MKIQSARERRCSVRARSGGGRGPRAAGRLRAGHHHRDGRHSAAPTQKPARRKHAPKAADVEFIFSWRGHTTANRRDASSGVSTV
ncbi:hypothetical protein EVAR_63318_1 [Eumeta japonica]|uniref:Uncharacterized protein n=1 Tax=Eumeta variegata TaxID=151549 RepID=A0A4C1YKM9_EUMVA|nr:hypothetical protein EVAR_63318_1 [Eumeta japonica]